MTEKQLESEMDSRRGKTTEQLQDDLEKLTIAMAGGYSAADPARRATWLLLSAERGVVPCRRLNGEKAALTHGEN